MRFIFSRGIDQLLFILLLSERSHAVSQVIQQLSAESMGDFLNSKNFKKFQDNQVTCRTRYCPCQWHVSSVRGIATVTMVSRRGEPLILL